MRIILHKNFIKMYKRLRPTEQRHFKEQRDQFWIDPYHPTLNNHALRGKYTGYRSINITGDIRAIYKLVDNDTFLFVTIGTHKKLYRE